MSPYLSAEEAARRLNVSRQTLYAYVSRGMIAAIPAEDPRQSLYAAEDIDRLAVERRRGRRPKEVARSTIDWGVPILESAITLIRDGHLFYRGRDAVALAENSSLEDVAGLIWDLPQRAAFPPRAPEATDAYRALLPLMRGQPTNQVLLTLFTATSEETATAHWHDDPERLATGCGELVRALAAAALGRLPSADPVHVQFGSAFGLDAAGQDLVRRALVLCADHELNVSGFTARCIASSGASVRAAVTGGIAALSGYRHGSMTVRVERLWDGLDGAGDLRAALGRRLDAGEDIPGFGHPLYPKGDVRAKAILSVIGSSFPRATEIAGAAEALTGKRPTIDFALVALARHLGLPDGTAFILFAVGRSLGWIAHALEQRASATLIRPRAVYSGPQPEDTAGEG